MSEWAITWGAEPGASSWNGWKNGAALSKDAAKPTPWDADGLYDGAGFYVSHRGKVWMSRWYITRGQEPGANTWNGWKLVRSLRWAGVFSSTYRSFAINEQGELYGWGNNYAGRLGDGTTTDRDSPIRIGAAADWKKVSGRGLHSLAINTKGELYAWGYNGNGQLGDGTNTDQSSPVKIVAHP